MIRIRVQPRARREEVVGERGEFVVVRVTAPPVDGKANAAVVKLIARCAGVPRHAVEIVAGAGGREKLVRVEGVSDAGLRAALLAASNKRPAS
jgi:uncharacterized protein (TIGR00251 family)